jgi:NAD+ kinase
MSGQLSSPTAIHPVLNNPWADSESRGLKFGLSSTSERQRPSTSCTAPPSCPSLQTLSLDDAKAQFRNVEFDDPLFVSPALGAASSAITPPGDSAPAPLPLIPPQLPQATTHLHPDSVPAHETVPRQTLMKALASVARNNKPQALSLNGMLSAQSGAERPTTASSQKLCDALNDLAQRANTPTTAFPNLQSPCYYHQRFDDAVDIDKVLEEIKNDEFMSHSRLVQTATGVREVSKQLQRRPIKRAVRNVMIVTKARDNELVLLTRDLALWLLRTPRYGSDLGVNVYVDAKLRNSKRFGASSILEENDRFQTMLRYWTPDLCWSQPEKFDLVLTLGGDGTVLFTSWLFQRIVPPVLSFSLGSLGFLTTFEFARYKDHLDRVMGNEGMRVNLRMRFTCTVYRDGSTGDDLEEAEQFEVLNELVIDRGPSPYVSNLELYGDNELLTVVQADGCIFSTPTGKTFYPSLNLSTTVTNILVVQDQPLTLCQPAAPLSTRTSPPFCSRPSARTPFPSGQWSCPTRCCCVSASHATVGRRPTAPSTARAASS